MKSLLRLRKLKRIKMPDFVKQQAKTVKKLKKNWRRPRGVHSKTRRKFIGRAKHPTVGYASPRAVRGLNRDGLEMIFVKNVSELENINKEKQVVVIAHVGQKRKYEIVKKCIEKGLFIENIVNPKMFIEKVEKKLAKKKAVKKKVEEEKKAKKESEEKKETKNLKKEKEEKTEEAKPEAKEEKKVAKKKTVKKKAAAKKEGGKKEN